MRIPKLITLALFSFVLNACTPEQCAMLRNVKTGLGIAETVLSVAAPMIGIGLEFDIARLAANSSMDFALKACDGGKLDQAAINDAIAHAEEVIALYKKHQSEIPAGVSKALIARGMPVPRGEKDPIKMAYAAVGKKPPKGAQDFDPDKLLEQLESLRQ